MSPGERQIAYEALPEAFPSHAADAVDKQGKKIYTTKRCGLSLIVLEIEKGMLRASELPGTHLDGCARSVPGPMLARA